MNHTKTGALIKQLRREKNLTQSALAQLLCVSDRTISKWERGGGYPDISLLAALCEVFSVSIEHLLSGELDYNTETGGNMKHTKFYICPTCKNFITSTADVTVNCCGRTLEPLTGAKPDEAHSLSVQTIDGERFISAKHPMTKEHYISHLMFLTGERMIVLKSWPEWDFQHRLPMKGHGILLWHCVKDGLFQQLI